MQAVGSVGSELLEAAHRDSRLRIEIGDDRTRFPDVRGLEAYGVVTADRTISLDCLETMVQGRNLLSHAATASIPASRAGFPGSGLG